MTLYQKPHDITSARQQFDGFDDARYLAGGMTLLPTMRQRLVAPDGLIDLSDCALSGISQQGDQIIIGAMTTHHDVSQHALISDKIPALAALAGGIGDRQVRRRGTCGGSVANNDPAACYPAALLALNATIMTNQRMIQAQDYFIDLFETALEEGELITAISFPIPVRAGYIKAPNPASRYALVGSFVAQFDDVVRVAITGAGENGVYRWLDAETALAQKFDAESLSDLPVLPDGLMGDIHASPAFRAHMIKTMTQRAIKMALSQSQES